MICAGYNNITDRLFTLTIVRLNCYDFDHGVRYALTYSGTKLFNTTDEGSSPKRIEIQSLRYILYLTKFMYSLVVIAARTNKHFIGKTFKKLTTYSARSRRKKNRRRIAQY